MALTINALEHRLLVWYGITLLRYGAAITSRAGILTIWHHIRRWVVAVRRDAPSRIQRRKIHIQVQDCRVDDAKDERRR
jgi:hypothetical protein